MLQFQETRNVIKKEAEKILKYRDLTMEIQGILNVKAKVIPLVTGDWNLLKVTQAIPEQYVERT